MVSPFRMAFALTAPAIDFTGATTVLLAARRQGDEVSFYFATVKEGQRYAAVDWGDGSVEIFYPDGDRKVDLRHVYGSYAASTTIRISDTLDEFSVSGVTLTGVYRTSLSVSPFDGARLVSGVTALGSNIAYRSFTRGMFANTSITEMPSVYSFGNLSPLSSAPCVPLACFYGCSNLSSVRALTGVVAIDAFAFGGCTSLQSVSQFSASSLVHIGYRAFAGCTNLISLDGLTGTLTRNAGTALFGRAISSFTSEEKEALFSELDPEGSRNFRVDQFMLPVGREAFQGCTKLTDISALKFSGGIILPGTFDSCTSLATIPDAVKNCYYGYGHEGLEVTYKDAGCICLLARDTVVMSDDDRYVCTSGGLTTYGIGLDLWNSGGAFTNTKITDIVGVPRAGRVLIANDEFSGCSALTSVTISGVDKLGYNAFSGCTSLTDVTFTLMTKASVQRIVGISGACFIGYSRKSCPFGLPVGCIIHCSDGDLRVVSGDSVEEV